MKTEDRHGRLIEWDAFETAASPKAAETFIKGKIAEWGDADRAEFGIVRNEPPADPRVEVWERGDRIAVSRDGLPVGEVTKVGDSFSARVFCVTAPYDRFGGVHESVEAAVDFVGEEGETPDYIRERTR